MKPEPAEVLRSALELREGRLYADGATNTFSGLMTEVREDLQLKSRSVISNGVLEGLSEGWYTNGTKQVQEYFLGGVSHGVRTKWYPSGEKLSEAPIVNGKIHGTYLRWHENGQLSEVIAMKEGQPEGLSLAFYPSGFLKARTEMKAGQIVTQEFWTDGEVMEDVLNTPDAVSDQR